MDQQITEYKSSLTWVDIKKDILNKIVELDTRNELLKAEIKKLADEDKRNR